MKTHRGRTVWSNAKLRELARVACDVARREANSCSGYQRSWLSFEEYPGCFQHAWIEAVRYVVNSVEPWPRRSAMELETAVKQLNTQKVENKALRRKLREALLLHARQMAELEPLLRQDIVETILPYLDDIRAWKEGLR